MRNLKKFLALVLAMVMAMSLMVSVNAAVVNPDNATNKYGDGTQVLDEFKEAVDVLSGMGVFKGDEVGFRPADTITRGEVAAIIYRLVTGDVDDNRAPIYSGWGNFTDVASTEWFAPYVGYLANGLIVKGTTPTTYEPYAPVTGYEALAMILRAVGYDKNGEFTGSGWTIEVSRIATERNMLKNINKTNYSNLNDYARRDLVAELLFQAAQLKTVIYTPAFGYQTGTVTSGVSSNNTDSLGWTYFGLVSNTGIVVGNQDTGEGSTLIAMTGEQNDNSGVARASYAYGDSRSYNTTTTLDMFGHAIKVWYDGRMFGNRTTYAWYDRASKDTIVRSVDANGTKLHDGDTDYVAAVDKTPAYWNHTNGTNLENLGKVANANGFNVGLSSFAHISDRYGRISTETYHQASGVVDANTGYRTEDYNNADRNTEAEDVNVNACNLYRLISNNPGNGVDVIISLAGEVAQITRHDTTSTTKTLQLGDKFVTGDFGGTGAAIQSKFGVANDGKIRFNSLTSSSVSTLGAYVTGWEVKGTNRDSDDDTVNTRNKNLKFYQLNQMKTVTGTVAYYQFDDATRTSKVTLTDGRVLTFTILPDVDDIADREPVNGFNTGSYTFYLDDFGNYVTFTQGNDYKFLYGTYADYDMGALGTGTIRYTISGVRVDASQENNLDLKSISNVPMTGSLYEGLVISKKNQGGATGNGAWIGNEVQAGRYYGYRYNATTGDIIPVDPTYTEAPDADVDGIATNGNENWVLRSSDVKNGFLDVSEDNDGSLLITPNTKFILVSGLGGSADRTVEVRTGMADLLRSSDWVRLDVGELLDAAGNPTTTPAYNVYAFNGNDVYNNVETDWETGTKMVDTMIIPMNALSWSSSERFFTNVVSDDGLVLVNANIYNTPELNEIHRYTMWNGSEKGSYWIYTAGEVDGKDTIITDAVVSTTKGAFFDLMPWKVVAGQQVYIATVHEDDEVLDNDYPLSNGCGLSGAYTYTSVNNTSTGMIGGKIYNVSTAVVVDVTKGAVAHSEIKTVQDINNAISVGYDVTVAVVNAGVNVSLIYVTDVQLRAGA